MVDNEINNRQLFINSTPTMVEIALLEDKKLVELHHQKTNTNFTVGDIFVGRIKKLMPGLNAAFVDIGYSKDAFLHYTDMGPKLDSVLKFTKQSMVQQNSTHRLDNFEIPPDIDKKGKVNQVLNKKKYVLVQILKEPISTKGPRLTCEITLPGRYIVLSPFQNTISISKKIGNSEERKRLKTLVESIRPKNFGVIVRTAAEGKKVADLHEEVMNLTSKWKEIHKQLSDCTPPQKLLSELDKSSTIIRDLLSTPVNQITVNDKELQKNLLSYVDNKIPDLKNNINTYNGKRPIFDNYGVTKQIKALFGKSVTMKSGAYLVIEHTEAMHVIDVNSGQKNAQKKDLTKSILNINMESAAEIARQLRLRDIGGLIIVDFIDMRDAAHRKELYFAMKEFMKSDRAQHSILPLSKFGLMQITRQRTRPEVKIETAEICPTCSGSGKISSSILITDEIQRDLEFVMKAHPKTKLKLEVHPFIASFLTKGFKSHRMDWFLKHGRWVKIESNIQLPINSYKFYNGNDEIRLGQNL